MQSSEYQYLELDFHLWKAEVSCYLTMIGGHGAPKYSEVSGKWVTHSPGQQSEGTFIFQNMVKFSF